MARDPKHCDVALPSLTFFENQPDLWEYVMDGDEWPGLEAALDRFKDFHVVDALTQGHQEKFCKVVDSNVDLYDHGLGIMHGLASLGNDSKAALLVRRLLQMGCHPDLVAAGSCGWTPSYLCAQWGSLDSAQALVACRPNLELKDTRNGRTPAAEARGGLQNGNLPVMRAIASLLEDAEGNKFPTIAQLAQEEKWWAVQNLCRRGVVEDEEKFALHGGKDAIGWAVHYRKLHLAEELAYLLKGAIQPKINEEVLETLAALQAQLQKINGEKDAIEGRLDKQAAQQAMSRKEGDELKEMLLLNLTKTNEDYQELKKELTALREQVNSKLKNNPQEVKQTKVVSKGLQEECMESSRRAAAPQRAGPTSDFKAVGENAKDEKIATLEAENNALKEKFSQLQEAFKTQAALLGSFLHK